MATDFPGFVVPTEADPWLKRAFDLLTTAIRGGYGLNLLTPSGRRFRLKARDADQDALLDVDGLAGDGTGQNPGTGFVTVGSVPLGADVWHLIGQPGEPAFANSWVNYGSGYVVARYRRDAWGFVHLEGAVKTGTLAAAAFTLPVGYRPAYRLRLPSIGGGPVLGTVDVVSDGTVVPDVDNTFNCFSVVFRGEQ